MAKPYFKFKQFTVYHDRSSLKVGTDAVLLGSWADVSGASKIFDIGTGSGVIALMLAQRSNAMINAIDIDIQSCEQANENFKSSPWSDRLSIYNISLSEYAEKTATKYDLVVSNPPYFTDSFKPANEQRFSAKHNDKLPIAELSENVAKLLSHTGKFCVILPLKEAAILTSEMNKYGLFPHEELSVLPLKDKDAIRKLILFGRENTVCKTSQLVIETDERHAYSKEYIELTKDYYMNF